ncbi:MAG: epoxyqueuosine reductase QueH [Clostridia bacterium]|nr:epoxyqueuosine reductase QueH [Clostridia bacterium]MBQ6883825.1 epoxyqueuosine reductase QueH [Clostridia bacterium]
MDVKTNYDFQFDNIVKGLETKKRLLLHACCAPCASSVLERVTPYFDVTIYFYNPNITDRSEYLHRYNELLRFVSIVYGDKIKVIDGGFDPRPFIEAARGLEDEPERGLRCDKCFYLRLKKTAELAKVGLYDYYCTTLSVSPHKNAQLLNELGFKIEQEELVKWLPSDFKKKQGYVRSIELSKEYDLYRQNYCGCVFSQKLAEKNN